MDGCCGAVAEDRFQIVGKSLAVLKRQLLVACRILERDLHTLVEITRHLEPLLDRVGVELDLGKNRRIGPEEHARPGAACRPEPLYGANRLPLLEAPLPLR